MNEQAVDLGPRVSYAQNGEDIVLARAFTDTHGFYVDIGAFDPLEDSVTKLFYDRGWNGINVDPVPEVIERFDRDRPRDVNLQVAVSEESGEAELWTGPAGLVGHSTLDATIAQAHGRDGLAFGKSTARTVRLEELLDEWVPEGTTIDFLKVDVEGHERAVLASNDWKRWRPRVVVVECVAPYLDGSTHTQWEALLLESEYVMVLFDGLNRFFVAAEHAALIDPLQAPASVIDNFEKFAVRQLNLEFQKLVTQLHELHELRGQEHASWGIERARLSQQLEDNVERQRQLRVEIDRFDARLAESESRADALETELSHVRAHETALGNELAAFRRTKLYRVSQRPRTVYRWLRELASTLSPADRRSGRR